MSLRRSLRTLVALVASGFAAVSCSETMGPSGTTITVASITPSTGSTSGGTSVTITGTNFAAGAVVTIGGVAASQVNVGNATTLTAVTGAHAAGAASVVVTVNGQSGTLPNGFTYVAPGGSNVAPTIQSLRAQGSRTNQPASFADLGEAIAISATVTDPETPVGNLIYEWSAPAGTFEGSGSARTWRAPQTFATPGVVTLTLTVLERYTSGGVQHEHRVTGTIDVKVHDSVKEVGDMSRKFLLLFSDSSVPPDVVVQDFLPGCGAGGAGREAELNDTTENRAEVTITQHNIGAATVSINFGGTCSFRNRSGDACAQVPVEWRDVEKGTGTPGHTVGTEYLTAIYNGTRWGLCDAEIEGSHTRGALPLPISVFRK